MHIQLFLDGQTHTVLSASSAWFGFCMCWTS